MTFVDSPFAAARRPLWSDLLPSLSLTPFQLWRPLFPGTQWIDFAYWTLIVEVRFYIFAAALYWMLPDIKLGMSLTAIAVINFLLRFSIGFALPAFEPIYSMITIPNELPWFAAGCVFYHLFKAQISSKQAAILLSISFIVILKMVFRSGAGTELVFHIALCTSFFFIFWLVANHSNLVRPLGARWLVSVGVWSYSIYLLHNPVGLMLISAVPQEFGIWTSTWIVVGIALFVIVLGFFSFSLIERHGQRLALKIFLGTIPSKQLNTTSRPD